MWRTVPRRSMARPAVVAIVAVALMQVGAAPGEEEKSGAASQGAGNGRRHRVRG